MGAVTMRQGTAHGAQGSKGSREEEGEARRREVQQQLESGGGGISDLKTD